jgi:hypothetical protein
VNVRLLFAQAGLEAPPGTSAGSWKQKSYEKRARAIALLKRRHPVLKKAEGDWAAQWLLKRRAKTHNRTLKERSLKRKDPHSWAAKEAGRKIKTFHRLNEDFRSGDIETVEEALYRKALRDNGGARSRSPTDSASGSDRSNHSSRSSSRDSSRSSSRDSSRSSSRDTSRSSSRDSSRSSTRDTSRSSSRDTIRSSSRDTIRSSSRDTSRDSSPEPSRKSSQAASPEPSGDSDTDSEYRRTYAAARAYYAQRAADRSEQTNTFDRRGQHDQNVIVLSSDDELYDERDAPASENSSDDKRRKAGSVNRSDYKRSNDKISDDKISADKRSADKRSADKRSNDKISDDKRSNDKRSAEKRSAEKRSNDKISDDKISDGKRSADKRSADKRSADKISDDKISDGKRSADKRSADKRSADKRSGDKISADKRSGDKISADKISDDKRSADKRSDEKRTNDKRHLAASAKIWDQSSKSKILSSDDELYAPAPARRSDNHTDDRRPHSEQDSKRLRKQGQRQRSPSEPVALITDGKGFGADNRDVEGYDTLGFNAFGVNRTGQFISDFPPQLIDKLKRKYEFCEANRLPWAGPPTLNMDRLRDEYKEWYETRERRFPAEAQVRNP